jgi:hypothetical protein
MKLQSVINVILKKSPVSLFSPICFQRDRIENGNKDSTSEAHLKN